MLETVNKVLVCLDAFCSLILLATLMNGITGAITGESNLFLAFFGSRTRRNHSYGALGVLSFVLIVT